MVRLAALAARNAAPIADAQVLQRCPAPGPCLPALPSSHGTCPSCAVWPWFAQVQGLADEPEPGAAAGLAPPIAPTETAEAQEARLVAQYQAAMLDAAEQRTQQAVDGFRVSSHAAATAADVASASRLDQPLGSSPARSRSHAAA
jgi:hypothetical protein